MKAPIDASHHHPKDDIWNEYYIKVDKLGDPSQTVQVWLVINDKGSWSDIPSYDKNPSNYIKLA